MNVKGILIEGRDGKEYLVGCGHLEHGRLVGRLASVAVRTEDSATSRIPARRPGSPRHSTVRENHG
jgi:hypothetical protein